MEFSNRIQQVNPSMTLAIDAKAKEMKANGEDVIGFASIAKVMEGFTFCMRLENFINFSSSVKRFQ